MPGHGITSQQSEGKGGFYEVSLLHLPEKE